MRSELAVDLAPRHGPFPGRLDAQRISAYAAATGDTTVAVLTGAAVPAVFPVILVFGAQEAANGDLPPEAWAGTQVILHIEQFDAQGHLVVEQFWTTLLFGLSGMADMGAVPSQHRFPDAARANPIGSVIQHVDEQTARRYAEVSGDWSAHHFDIDSARVTGFDFLFTHGLCTMAMCGHAVLGLIGIEDPGRVRRVAVRFAAPTRMGADLSVSAFGITDEMFAFEASCAGATVITHGRLELRS